ncbi:MAG TPA: hypothetical protein V6D28_17640 [Leptolyngbyaceae cyanobacterium]
MSKQSSLESDGRSSYAALGLPIEAGEIPTFLASPSRRQTTSESDLLVSTPADVYLNLEDLKCFEVVDRQFQRWGVLFHNCIAIHPSNPAFPAHSGATVLMGAPKTGWLEASFVQPVCLVKAFVTTSQRLVLSAYDRDNQRLTQVEIPGQNLAGSDSEIPPNLPLSLKAPNIHRVTFCAFDGQFTVDDFSFQF